MVVGLVTAAGLGSRSGLDGRMRKELLSLYDTVSGKLVLRPVLDIVIRKLENAGCRKVVVVVDPSDGMTISYLETNFPEAELVFQAEKLGYGDAVFRGAKECANQDVLLNAGDGFVASENYYQELVQRQVSTLTLFRVDNPTSYGNAVLSKDQSRVIDVSEKPEKPLSNLALAATYFFNHNLLKYITEEHRELTDSIKGMVSENFIRPYIIEKNLWLSIGKKENYYKVVERSFRLCGNGVI